jgi:hypothetical protein
MQIKRNIYEFLFGDKSRLGMFLGTLKDGKIIIIIINRHELGLERPLSPCLLVYSKVFQVIVF